MELKYIIVDDEENILEDTKAEFEAEGAEIAAVFSSSTDALKYVIENKVEVAVLDIEMPRIKGIELAKLMKSYHKDIQIIFTTGYEEYALEAYNIHALAYLLKPFLREEIRCAIENAKRMIKGIRESDERKQVSIVTFGRFDLYVNDTAIYFGYEKAKELLALLVDARGGIVTMGQAISVLWEDRTLDEKTKQLYRKTVSRLRGVLRGAGIENIVRFYRGSLAMDVDKVVCDYYKAFEGNRQAIDTYVENYMMEYDWAEMTNAMLRNKLDVMKA